jgi:hypothetical protein
MLCASYNLVHTETPQTGKQKVLAWASFIKTQCALSQRHPPKTLTKIFSRKLAANLRHALAHTALNRRGWVTQEPEVSREILRFTLDGLYRECYVAHAHSQYGGLEHDKLDTQLNCVRISLPHWLAEPLPEPGGKPLPNQSSFLEAYSRTEFTNPEDRLIALSSLAKVLQPFFGKQSILRKLMELNSIEGILWYNLLPRVSSTISNSHIAPSWSWASAMGIVWYFRVVDYGQPNDYLTTLLTLDRQARVQLINVFVRPAQLDNPPIRQHRKRRTDSARTTCRETTTPTKHG